MNNELQKRMNDLVSRLNGKYEGRTIVWAMVYGSHNYGTNDETSDYDFKMFVMPTFEDIYGGKLFNSSVKINGDDVEVHDIRKLHVLWSKANPSYLEILEAKAEWINSRHVNLIKRFKKNKHRIAKSNLKAYYDAITGMAKQKAKAIEKDLPNSQENEGYKRRMKFGFDSKQLLHVRRLMAMREEVFMNGNQKGLEDEPKYKSPLGVIDLTQQFGKTSNLVGLRQELLDIKKNVKGLTKDEAIVIANDLIWDMKTVKNFGSDKSFYDMLVKDEEMLDNLHQWIKEAVFREFKKGGM